MDLVGAGLGGLGLFRSSGGGSNGSQGGAMALSQATAMASSLSLAGSSGAFAGQKADELFQHFFAIENESRAYLEREIQRKLDESR